MKLWNDGHTWEQVARYTQAPSPEAAMMMARRYAHKHGIKMRNGNHAHEPWRVPPKHSNGPGGNSR